MTTQSVTITIDESQVLHALLGEAKSARLEAKNAWLRQATEASDTFDETHAAVMIGATQTYWSRGNQAGAPLFLSSKNGGLKFTLIWLPVARAVAVYDSTQRDWIRCGLLTTPTSILTALPAHAFAVPTPDKPATEKQIAALRKILAITADEQMPPITARFCSHLINKFAVERGLQRIAPDIAECECELAGTYQPSIEQ